MTSKTEKFVLLDELKLLAGLYHYLNDGSRAEDMEILEVGNAVGGVVGYFLNNTYYGLISHDDIKCGKHLRRLGYLLDDQYHRYQDEVGDAISVAEYKNGELIFDEGQLSEFRVQVRQL